MEHDREKTAHTSIQSPFVWMCVCVWCHRAQLCVVIGAPIHNAPLPLSTRNDCATFNVLPVCCRLCSGGIFTHNVAVHVNVVSERVSRFGTCVWKVALAKLMPKTWEFPFREHDPYQFVRSTACNNLTLARLKLISNSIRLHNGLLEYSIKFVVVPSSKWIHARHCQFPI